MVRISLRIDTLEVPAQDVVTRDNVTVKVNAVIYFRVIEPRLAVVEVSNFLYATSQLAQTTLRSVLGEVELDELLSQREKLNVRLQSILDQHTSPWGVKVTMVEVKQVDLAEQMIRAIARQAEAERERRAKIIHAEGEYTASEKLAMAAEVIQKQPAAIQLRYLQTLVEIGTEKNTTIVFPLPIDIMYIFGARAGPRRQTGGDAVPDRRLIHEKQRNRRIRMVLGNRQLLSGFFIVVLLFAVVFAMGYMVGQNSPRSAQAGGWRRSATPVAACPTAGASRRAGGGCRAQPAPNRAAAPPTRAATTAASRPARTPRQPRGLPPRPRPRLRRGRRRRRAGARGAAAGTYWQVIVGAARRMPRRWCATLEGQGFPAFITPGPRQPDTRAGGALHGHAKPWATPRPSWKTPGFHPIL